MDREILTGWTKRFNDVIPWGTSTCSKAPRLLPDEPETIVRGQGCRVWDDRGREFIDFRNALGPITLGYRFPAVEKAIIRQLESGIIFGHPHPVECEAAEMLQEVIPCADQVRFLKTGGEAVAACIKLARHYTGKSHIVQVGYNGWLNALARKSRRLPGVVSADYATMAAGESFYPELRKLADRHGVVLIFDEIVTGFRVALGGVQERFAVTPDLAVFAKGIANGMPISVYCGRRDIMSGLKAAIVSSTYGGETLSLAALKASVSTYLEEDVISHLWLVGKKIVSGFNGLAAHYGVPIRAEGLPPCSALVPHSEAPDGTLDKLMRACFANGLSLYTVLYVNYSHSEDDIEDALSRLENAMTDIS